MGGKNVVKFPLGSPFVPKRKVPFSSFFSSAFRLIFQSYFDSFPFIYLCALIML